MITPKLLILMLTMPLAAMTALPRFDIRLAEDGRPYYRVSLGDRPVLDWSELGLVLSDRDLGVGERLESSDPVPVRETYTLVHGRQREVKREGQEVVHRVFRGDRELWALRVRTFDDGVAFRYELKDVGETAVTLLEEKTAFVPSAGLETTVVKKMDAPGNFTPAYEYHNFNNRPMSVENGIAFPMLLQRKDSSLWVLLAEAGLTRDHAGTRLFPAENNRFRIGLPDEGENPVGDSSGPRFRGSWVSPWRLVVVGENPGTIVESTLVTDVSLPSKVTDTSWIRPGFASWSWWSDSGSPKQPQKLKAFIDLASDFGWEYSLVDANWNRDQVPELVAYAREKGVGLFYWYNSGGDHNTVGEQPRDLMVDREVRRREMAWLRDAGIVGIKVDFFNSDKQARIAQYIDILEDAADFQLMVNFHGCTLPRGWERTYPHLMTMEAIRGGESYKFAGEWWNKLAPMHNVNAVFTRNVMGSVDYTPGIVSRKGPKYKTRTTAAHELALGVVLTSGVTHWCDAVEAYRALDPAVRDLLRTLPRTWDETRFLQGSPRDLAVLARRAGDRWVLAGISGRGEALELELPWDDFFGPDASVTVYMDDETGDAIRAVPGRKVRLAPYGGFVAREVTP